MKTKTSLENVNKQILSEQIGWVDQEVIKIWDLLEYIGKDIKFVNKISKIHINITQIVDAIESNVYRWDVKVFRCIYI